MAAIRFLGSLVCGALIGWMISLALVLFLSSVGPSAFVFGGGRRSDVVVGLATALTGIVISVVAKRRAFQGPASAMGWGIVGYGLVLVGWSISASHIGWW